MEQPTKVVSTDWVKGVLDVGGREGVVFLFVNGFFSLWQPLDVSINGLFDLLQFLAPASGRGIEGIKNEMLPIHHNFGLAGGVVFQKGR